MKLNKNICLMLQRSKEWYDVRLGRFTASRISELMGVKGLGLTGENYAFELACEEVFGIEEDADFVSSLLCLFIYINNILSTEIAERGKKLTKMRKENS